MASYSLGSGWALQQVATRFRAIRSTLATPSFPLSANVLGSIAGLTQTELVAYGQDGRLQSMTLPAEIAAGDRASLSEWFQLLTSPPTTGEIEFTAVTLSGERYLAAAFKCLPSGGQPTSANADAVGAVVVLFAQRDIDAAKLRAAMLPLVTGLSTVVLLSTLTLALTGRLVQRLERLEKRVERVASGNFDLTVVDDPATDEIGRLGSAVNRMAEQLDQLWQAVNRQQRGKLLHQIAAGLAHQLRNSLTGARMAMELHARRCTGQDDEGLQVATIQLDQVEDTVKRLLTVGADHAQIDQPAQVHECLQNTQLTLTPFARHWQVDAIWTLSDELKNYRVPDGPTLSAAVTNLVMNAMQAGKIVRINAELITMDSSSPNRELKIEVSDNGPGIAAHIAGEVFEPFVTSKPEGLGLGLSVVRRSAESLSGNVQWSRDSGWTRFTFTAKIEEVASDSSSAG